MKVNFKGRYRETLSNGFENNKKKIIKTILIVSCMGIFSCSSNRGQQQDLNHQEGNHETNSPVSGNVPEADSDSGYIASAYMNGLEEIELCDHFFKNITNGSLKEAADAIIKAHDVL